MSERVISATVADTAHTERELCCALFCLDTRAALPFPFSYSFKSAFGGTIIRGVKNNRMKYFCNLDRQFKLLALCSLVLQILKRILKCTACIIRISDEDSYR